MSSSSLKTKIESLLRKAADPSITEEESHLFEQKAIELMVREGIVESDLSVDAEDTAHKIIRWEREFYVGRHQIGIEILFTGINKIFGVAAVRLDTFRPWQKHGDHQEGVKITCWSTQSQKDMTEAWLDHLVLQMQTHIKRDRPRSRRNYSLAWSNRVLTRMEEFIGVSKEADAFSSGSALALIDNHQAMENELGHKIGPGQNVSHDDSLDALDGYLAGSEASMLGKSIGGGTVKELTS